MTETHHAYTDSPGTQDVSDLSLDRLAALDTDALTDLYRAGRVPDAGIAALSGSPPCRMLTPRSPLDRGVPAAAIRRFAASSLFPWAGKSFSPLGADAGRGVNRLRIAGLARDAFPFTTAVGHSAIDGLPCIILDYEQPENPWLIRQVHDELREVAPGLFLGPAMWKTRTEPKLLLYFAADLG